MSDIIFIKISPVEPPIIEIVSIPKKLATLALDYKHLTGNDFVFKFTLVIPINEVLGTKIIHGYVYTITREINLNDLSEFFATYIFETLKKENFSSKVRLDFLNNLTKKVLFARGN